MSTIVPIERLANKSLKQCFVLILVAVLTSGFGLMIGLFIRDFFVEILRRCEIYDSEKGLKGSSLVWLIFIPLAAVVVCSFIIIGLYHLERKLG